MARIVDALMTSVRAYCSTIGADPMLVQGAGGNVSWKDGENLWVKASGTWLAESADKDIFVPVDLPHLRTAIENDDFSVSPRVRGESKLRPSIETLLHALMPHRVVVHLHPIEVLAHVVRDSCRTDIKSRLGTSISWTMVDYHKPGAALAAAVNAELGRKRALDVVFLRNHGVVIGGFDVEEVSDLIHKLLLQLTVQPHSSTIDTTVVDPFVTINHHQYIPVDIPEVHNLVFCPDLFTRVKNDWALYPDHVVFLGAKAFCYNNVELLNDDLRAGKSPELFFLKGRGIFSKPDFSLAKKVQLKCYYDVIVRQPANARLCVLNDEQIDELLNWDAEQHRQYMSK